MSASHFRAAGAPDLLYSFSARRIFARRICRSIRARHSKRFPISAPVQRRKTHCAKPARRTPARAGISRRVSRSPSKSEPTTAAAVGSRHSLVRGTSMMKKNAAFIIDSAFRLGEGAHPSRTLRGKHHLIRSESRALEKLFCCRPAQSACQRVSSCAALRPLHARNGKAGRFAFISKTFELKFLELKTIESSSF